MMFGKPEWFVEKKIGWGLRPVTWQGWLYAAIWAAVIVVPFLALLSHGLAPEAAIWMAASIGVLTYDVWLILRAKRAAKKEVLYIGEEELVER